MTKSILIAMLLLTAAIVSGQVEVKFFLSQQQVTDLRNSLNKNIEDTTRIRILLRLAKYHLESGNNEKIFLDSAALRINSAKKISANQTSQKWNGVILMYEASLAWRSGNRDSGRLLANQAITMLRSTNDQFHLAEAYLELSRCYDPQEPQQTPVIKKVFNSLFQIVPTGINRNEQDSCMSVLMNFYVLKMTYDSDEVKLDFMIGLTRAYQILNDKVHELWTRKEIADLHYKQGQLKMAINELLEVAKEQKEGGYPGICFTYDLLSGLYYAGADNNKALYYSLESIKHVKTATDSAHLISFYDRIAAAYSQTGSITEALDWSRKSLNRRIEQNQLVGIYTIVYDMTLNLIKLKRPVEALDISLALRKRYTPDENWEKHYMLISLAKCYVALNKYEIVEQYCDELIKLDEFQKKQGERPNNVIMYQFLADFYLDAMQYSKAETYLKKTMDEWPKSGRHLGVLYQNKYLFRLDSAKGNYVSAIKNLQNYHLIKDSITTVIKAKQIDELKIAYQTEQKDSLINLKEQNIQLLTKQDELQKSKLKQGAILRNISFAVATLLIIIMALLYNRYRLKQKTNKKLEVQQREIAKQNFSLSHLVNEKDWLLKEIHHRVKNNLQIVMSLLNSQSAYIDNEHALTAIHDSQHRVHAMSLIHQKLYNTENLSSIDMSYYVRELVSYLRDSFDTGQRIRFEMNIESLELDVSQAVPVGLILNEAITNSIKYAFPGDMEGVITISLSNTGFNNYLLTISDNGIGMPIHVRDKKPGSLGMSLMAGLSEDLDGNFSLENNNGTIIKVSFVHDVKVKRPDISAASFASIN